MEIERQHRTTNTPTTTTTTSELFICFTSRLTKSSSMRLSSKSIQSPSHTTTETTSKPTSHSHSLSTSLSKRLRHNRSLRGAQSPAMFPSSSSKKNRGSSVFTTENNNNAEPSSPKVTCIGQVRVKTRKQGKKMKMRACRSKSKRLSNEVSFRRVETSTNRTPELQTQNSTQECGLNQRNQRWVHLPLTICEALRAFGSEFSCLFPCKSSCFSSGVCGGGGNGKEGERERERESGEVGNSSCAVFRWLVSLQEGEEEGKRRDIELVVGEEEEVLEREVVMERESSRRRSIFDDMEFDDLFQNNNNGSYKSKSGEIVDDDEGGEGRVSVCVPPKNALLLMRCRSDPLKMASLSRKLWDPPLVHDHDDDDGGGDDVEVEDVVVKVEEDGVNEVEEKTEELQGKTEVLQGKTEVLQGETEELQGEAEELQGKTEEIQGEAEELEDETEVIEELESNVEVLAEVVEEEEIHEGETEEKQRMENRGNSEDEKGEIFEETHQIEGEIIANECSIEPITVEDMVFDDENEQDSVISNLGLLFHEEEEVSNEMVISEINNNSSTNEEVVKEEREESSEMSTISSATTSLNSSEESTAESKFEEEKEETTVVKEEERKTSFSSMDEKEKENEGKLPDCLLLMMCEPKLSMEVSKETWVCSTDFIRWLPERHQSKKTAKTEGLDESAVNHKKKKPAAVGPVHHVPVQQGRSSISFPAGSVANLIEKKLVKTGTYEPFVLTRCKSAPIRPTAKISAPEMACGRKIEPHRPATFGVGF